MDSPLEPLEEAQPCLYFDFSSVKLILDFRPPVPKENKCVLF